MRKRTLVVGLLALQATIAMGQAKLTGIEATKAGDGLQIVIQGEGLTQPRTSRILKNTAFIVEFDGSLVGKSGKLRPEFPGVQYVQYGWYSAHPPKCRVLVKLDAGLNTNLVQSNGQWIVTIGNTGLESMMTQQGTGSSTSGAAASTTGDRLAMEQAMKELTEKVGGLPDVEVSNPNTLPEIIVTPEEPKTAKAKDPKAEASAVLPEAPFKVEKTDMASLATDTKPQRKSQNVSLDFVGTDIVQILKALSIQAGVNIVTSPEVSPSDKPLKLSITLNNVDLESALSYVTAMASLRYARIGNTFVVTPSANFSTAMRQIMERTADSYQTRVVNLMSGDAEKIKEATLKALPPDGKNGYYELIVPGQNDVTPPPAGGQPTTGDKPEGGTADAGAQASTSAPPTSRKGRAYYLMIVGDPTRMEAVERYVHEVDIEIAKSYSLNRASSTSTVAVPIQSGQTEKIKSMIERLLQDNPRNADYSITETSVKELEQGEQSTKFLLMIGPGSELEMLKNFAVALDRELCKPLGIEYVTDTNKMVKDYAIVELKYIEPIIAAQDLKGRFKDLWVTVAPDAATPGIKGEGESKKNEAPTDAGTGQGAAAKAPEEQKSELKKELGKEPMRLVLRGTTATIEEAKKYLALIDTAPRQVALELRVLEMTKEDAFKLGLDWSILAGGRGSVLRINQGLGNSASDPGTFSGTNNFGQKTDGVSGKKFFENVSALGTLDSITNDRNLIARPNALVTHGRETNLFVGDTIRYVKQVQATQTGITVITDQLQVGSTFGIKAKIGDEGNIALDLMQNFSILTGFTAVPGGGQLPQTSDRTSSMFVNMKSGETIAIGGLILDNDRKSYGGIPLLKDLPLIGRIFGRTNNNRSRTEIVFFLTAVEVNDGNRADAASPGRASKLAPDPIGDYKKSKAVDKKKID